VSENNKFKAVILAAGRGSRMGGLTDELPKCRTILHGKELIEWQIESLTMSGISDLSIVRGYLAETFDIDVMYFNNNRWSDTNMVVSLLSADQWLNESACIVSYSDIVYSSDAVRRLMAASGDIVITYDPNWRSLWEMRFTDPLSDAESFKLDEDMVVEIGNKTESIDDIEGQYMGLCKFTSKGWGYVKGYLSKISQKSIDKMDMTCLLSGLIKSGIVINAVPITDRWFEVDTESDLNKYQQ
jgi:L-glutamine-phosphate cytidylyltransferase